MAGFLKNRRPFLSGYYLVDNLKRNYEIPSVKTIVKPHGQFDLALPHVVQKWG